MIRSRTLLLCGSAIFLVGCRHQSPTTVPERPAPRIRIVEDGGAVPAGERVALQFNDEPMTAQVGDGRGKFPILYHGQPIPNDRIKSVVILRTDAARQRFGDQSLDAAILIELK